MYIPHMTQNPLNVWYISWYKSTQIAQCSE